MLAALIIFGLSYLAISAQRLPFVRLDRPTASLCGAVAMVAFGVLDLESALRAVHLDVLALLLGVMIIAGYLTEARFFRYTAWWVLTRAPSARSLLWMLVFSSGALSALLVNDTVCLMLTPLVVAVAVEAGLPTLPYLIALASSTNIGGVVSFTGNPQNMIVGTAASGTLGYLDYFARALPVGILGLAVNAALLGWLFRRELAAVGELKERHPAKPFLDRRLSACALASLGLFVGLASLGYSLAGASVTAAAVCVLIARVPPKAVLEQLDWSLLLFFSGLFVLVEGVTHVPEIARLLAAGLGQWGSESAQLAAFGGATVIGSNLVSNVPFVLVAVKTVPAMPDPRLGYVVLAMASTLAGNLTMFGSVANIIVLQGAGPHGEIGFWRFFKVGAPITLATLLVATVVIALTRLLFG